MRELLCFIGFHKYKHEADYFTGLATNRNVTILWKTCKYCDKTKIKHIIK